MTESTVQEFLATISKMVRCIKELEPGWQTPNSELDKHKRFFIIEAESTGIHEGTCDEDGDYWIIDPIDCWPSHPLLVKHVQRKSNETTQP